MWLKRRKRNAKLSRQLALGLLQDAMGRVEEQQAGSGTSPQSGVQYQVTAPEPGGSRDGPSPDDGAKRLSA